MGAVMEACLGREAGREGVAEEEEVVVLVVLVVKAAHRGMGRAWKHLLLFSIGGGSMLGAQLTRYCCAVWVFFAFLCCFPCVVVCLLVWLLLVVVGEWLRTVSLFSCQVEMNNVGMYILGIYVYSGVYIYILPV